MKWILHAVVAVVCGWVLAGCETGSAAGREARRAQEVEADLELAVSQWYAMMKELPKAAEEIKSSGECVEVLTRVAEDTTAFNVAARRYLKLPPPEMPEKVRVVVRRLKALKDAESKRGLELLAEKCKEFSYDRRLDVPAYAFAYEIKTGLRQAKALGLLAE